MAESYNELKKLAAEYYMKNHVPERIEEILNNMFFENPRDIYGRLSEFFENYALSPVLSDVHGSVVYSSNGTPAVKCSLLAIVKNKDKFLASSYLALDNEMLQVQGQVYQDNESPPTVEEIADKTCVNINAEIAPKIKGIPLLNQAEIDKALSDWMNEMENAVSSSTDVSENNNPRTPTPSSGKKKKVPSGKVKGGKAPEKPIPPKEPAQPRLKGCSSISATSLVTLKASSVFLAQPPFLHLHRSMSGCEGKEEIRLPTPVISIITGGKSSPGKLNIFKNIFAISRPGLPVNESVGNLVKVYQAVERSLAAKSSVGVVTAPGGGLQPVYDKPEQPLDVVLEAIQTAGFTPGQDIYVGIETDATNAFDYDKGKYEISNSLFKSADELVELYRDLLARYPAVIMLIDPIRKEDKEQWPKLCDVISEKCFVIGGSSIYGPLHSLNQNQLCARRSSGVAIATGSRVTCSDLYRIVQDVRANGDVTILLSPPADASDDIYTDVGVGLGVDFVSFGAPSRGENVDRLNRFVEIEEILKQRDVMTVSPQKSFNFPLIKPPPAPLSDEEGDVILNPPDQKTKKK
ncbi:unnamed protein product [Clavelina lepadiformis]|uniref:Enolase 4 n=1 Tax=Clavelina lepadiformis TaxID=159417 RepID=A0ABP0GB05_CLALP